MAMHSSILAQRILWTEEPGGLLSMESHRVGHDWSDLACMNALEKEMATHSSALAWRIPGTGEPGGLPSMGSHRVGHDWSDSAAAAAKVTQAHLYVCVRCRSPRHRCCCCQACRLTWSCLVVGWSRIALTGMTSVSQHCSIHLLYSSSLALACS